MKAQFQKWQYELEVTSDHDLAHINDIQSLISGIILATLA
jgi:hypothetical protein